MLERTVNFDDKNSWSDFGVVFKTLVISPPEPRFVMIEVPYRNGLLDETDYYGDVTYANRNLKMDFLVPNGTHDHHDIYSNILNTLHGKRKQIRYSADDGWYYEGRLTVGDYSVNEGFWGFSIEATVDPYKYRDVSSYYSILSEGQEIIVHNNVMKTIPTFSMLESLDLTFEGETYRFNAGKHRRTDIILKEGNNIFTVSKIGKYAKLLIEFKEGRL